MKKIILVDGNNLLFRSYYATAYRGNMMTNSKGFPTNALYGFVNMINKIITEEKPVYMAVAFDIGKNFRAKKYKDYKAGRNATPEELKRQFPVAKKVLNAMGIKYLEMDNYEADDIIGTLVKMCEKDLEFDATIVSSDKDLLQLINFETDVKLLKQTGFIRYNEDSFKKDYGIDPINIIDLKALAGDSSDNIPGVKGVGDKTALNLLQQYQTIEKVYENIDQIKGKLQEKLINDQENAFFSKELATIYCDVPLNISLDDLIYKGTTDDLRSVFEELEFTSFLKNMNNNKQDTIDFITIESLNELNIKNDCAYYIECNQPNYHQAEILGMGLYDGTTAYYIKKELIMEVIKKYKEYFKYTFDLKKNIVLLKENFFNKTELDLMIASYLLEYNIKDDLSILANQKGVSIEYYDKLKKEKFNNINNTIVAKAIFIYQFQENIVNDLKEQNMLSLYQNIEHPLISILASMEIEGINVDKNILHEMADEVKIKIDIKAKDIYKEASEEFNISSPKQLGEILFIKMGLPYPKKVKTSFKTDITTLTKIIDVHPIIKKVLEYRNLTKIYSTYLEGLVNYIASDNKIHTIYKQNLTRTGRLSSVEPNLQNIPVKDDYGRKVRLSFKASKDSVLLCADYSQIELRILAHITNDEKLINAFNNNNDIHTQVASDIFGVSYDNVTKLQRKQAKAVIFGIVYGISGFGLGEDLNINVKDAKTFIDKYYELYPDVKKYMDNIIIKAKEDGCVYTLFNRKRTIDELKSNIYPIRQAGERIALNTPIQGTGADILKQAMIDVYEEMKKQGLKSKMILQVHDELIVDTLIEEEEQVKKILKDKMENAYSLSVPLIVEIEAGQNWYEVN